MLCLKLFLSRDCYAKCKQKWTDTHTSFSSNLNCWQNSCVWEFTAIYQQCTCAHITAIFEETLHTSSRIVRFSANVCCSVSFPVSQGESAVLLMWAVLCYQIIQVRLFVSFKPSYFVYSTPVSFNFWHVHYVSFLFLVICWLSIFLCYLNTLRSLCVTCHLLVTGPCRKH